MFIYSQGIIVYCIKSFGAAKVSAIWPSVRSHRGIASKDAMLEHVHGRIHSIAGSPLRARGRIERFFRGYGKKWVVSQDRLRSHQQQRICVIPANKYFGHHKENQPNRRGGAPSGAAASIVIGVWGEVPTLHGQGNSK